MLWSDEAALLRHPFERYEALGAAVIERPWRAVGIRVARLMFVLGLFVSLSTSGRVVLFHVFGTMTAWLFTPLVQATAVLVAARLFARDVPRAGVLGLYFAGHAPWMMLMWIAAAIVVVPPNPTAIFFFLLAKGILPGLLLAALVWGGVLNVAMFRRGLGLSRGKTALAMLVFYVLFVAQVVGYYFANDAIQPQLGMR